MANRSVLYEPKQGEVIMIIKRRLKDRVERLEENSEYHRRFMYEVNESLGLLLDHLNLEVEKVPGTKEHKRIVLKRKEKGK